MPPPYSKHSKLLLDQSRCGGNSLKTEIVLKFSQESSINGQINLPGDFVCVWRALLKQLVCQLQVNV